jgi:hypothetical protein
MGLDTSHGAWHGAYSAFHRWRQRIAKEAGFPQLDLMEWFWTGEFMTGSPMAPSLLPCDWNGSTAEAEQYWFKMRDRLPIKFTDTDGDKRLIPLLKHSDCDGDLAPAHCAMIADALEQLLPKLDGDGGGHIGNWRDKTQKFIDGCRAAAAAGEALEFH